MTENPPRVDRAAVERIIQRAAELQTGDRDIGEGLTSEEILALGKDVGIPSRYLQQAILEEQTRTTLVDPAGLLDRAFGPAVAAAQRVIRGEAEAIERRLLRWMDENELLVIQRQQPGRITWEPVRGMQAAFRRSAAALGAGKRPFMLAKAGGAAATITPLEPGFCHVSLTATLGEARGSLIGGGLGFASAGLAAMAALFVMTPFWWIAVAPVPVSLAFGYGVTRRYRPILERVQLGLERALDHLERGEIKPTHAAPLRGQGLVGMIAEEVRKALKP